MESSGFFNSKNKDRVYLAEVFAEYFASFIGNGVFPNPSTGLQVKAAEPNSMEIVISPGRAFINGYWYKLDEERRITLNNADGRLNRYDSIVLTLSKADRNILVFAKTGEAESTPYIPGVVRDEDTYELRLAHVSVKAGATKISNFDIVDDRLDAEVCGIVTGVVEQVDTTTLYNQIQADLAEFKDVSKADIAKWFNDSKADFESWFQSIQDKLGDDPATSLQQQVDNLNSAFAGGDLEVSNGTEQLFVRGIGDRISGFVIDGKTVQEGSGDPSPTNKRPIKGVGKKMVALDVTSSMNWYSQDKEHLYFEAVLSSSVPVPLAISAAEAKNNQFSNVGEIGNADSATADTKILIYVRNVESKTYIRMGGPDFATLEGFKSYLNSANAKIWYVPDDESQATGVYTFAAVESGAYVAKEIELAGTLYDGDKVDARPVESGCNMKVVFDGSSDENWFESSSLANRFVLNLSSEVTASIVKGYGYCNKFWFVSDPQNRVGECTVDGNKNFFVNTEIDTVEEWRAELAKSPLVIWIRTSNYVEQNDIKVSIETHTRVLFEFDGSADENWVVESVTGGKRFSCKISVAVKTSDLTSGSTSDCNWLKISKNGGTYTVDDTYTISSSGYFFVRIAGVDSVESLRETLAQKPLQLLATLTTPTVYAHEPADMSAFKDIEGNMTISAEGLVTVAFKSVSDASTLQGKDAWDIVEEAQPDFKTGTNQLMPYGWINGEDVFRQVIELGPDDFIATSTTQWYPAEGGSSELLVTTAESKKEVLYTQVEILPMTCAMSVSSDGNGFRPLSCVRPGSLSYSMGVRYDKGTTGYKIVLDIGSFHLDSFSKFIFVFYYTTL